MTAVTHHEQDVFAPATLQSVVATFEPDPAVFAARPCTEEALKLSRDAARHRNCRMRAIETLRRPGRGQSA